MGPRYSSNYNRKSRIIPFLIFGWVPFTASLLSISYLAFPRQRDLPTPTHLRIPPPHPTMDRDRQRTDPSRQSQPRPAASSGSYRGSYAPQPSHLQTSAPTSRSRQSPPTTPGDRYAGYPSPTRTTTDVYAGGSRRGEVPMGIGALPQNDPYWVGKRNASQTSVSPYGRGRFRRKNIKQTFSLAVG